MAYYCPRCGEEMVLEDDGDLYCDNCMVYYSQSDDYTDPDRHTWETDENDNYDGPGPGCAACGNPAYPDCMASCPMYDD